MRPTLHDINKLVRSWSMLLSLLGTSTRALAGCQVKEIFLAGDRSGRRLCGETEWSRSVASKDVKNYPRRSMYGIYLEAPGAEISASVRFAREDSRI